MHITGRKAPYAIGLKTKLRNRHDKVLEEAESLQAGVKLMLSVLRESREKVVINLVGSATDTAAAFNREPELFKTKSRPSISTPATARMDLKTEWNVGLDPMAYTRLLESGLPIYWCPCYGKDGYLTRYDIRSMSTFIGACTKPVQNYFVYCFTFPKTIHRFPSWWSTPIAQGRPGRCGVRRPMLHAAGRRSIGAAPTILSP